MTSRAWDQVYDICDEELRRILCLEGGFQEHGRALAEQAFLRQAQTALRNTGYGKEVLAVSLAQLLAGDACDLDNAKAIFIQMYELGLESAADRLGGALVALDGTDADLKLLWAGVKLWRGLPEEAMALAAPLADRGENLTAHGVMAAIGLATGAAWTEDYLLLVFRQGRRHALRLQRLLAQSAIETDGLRLDASRWHVVLNQAAASTRQWAAAMLVHARQPLPVEVLDLDFILAEDERRLWRAQARSQRDGQPGHQLFALNSALSNQGVGVVEHTHSDHSIYLAGLTTEAPGSPRHGPLVSVIMTAHAAQETIGYALSSLLSQSYRDIEVIVVDDASDPPVGLDVHDPRVRLVRLADNVGPYVARNAGLAEARGEFIAFQDADDWAHPDKVARQVDHLIAAPEAMATFARHVRMDRHGDLVLENDFLFIGDGPVTSLYRRAVFDRLGAFAPVRTRGDLEFKARVNATFGVDSIVHDDAILLIALAWQSNSKVQTAGAKAIQIRALKRRYAEDHKLAFFWDHPKNVDPISGEPR